MRDGSRKRKAGARSGSRRPRIRGAGRPAAYGAAALLAFGIVNCVGGGGATGATISTDQANYDSRHRGRTTPAGTFAPNAFGLHDVHGNVWEWVRDCSHRDYRGAPSDGTAWESDGDCGRRVLRGGSWSLDPRHLRSAVRFWLSAGNRRSFAGFRVARTLDQLS